MTHQQILDKLAAKHLVQSIDEDLANLTWNAMTYEKTKQIDDQISYILPQLLLRWNCALEADEKEVSKIYKQKTILALAILLHKYGYADKKITSKATDAIDKLNKDVVLSDDFFRKSKEIKKFIASKPVRLKKKPSTPKSMTFHREKEIVSIQLGNKFYAAYIHNLTGPNETPVIEFYNGIFDKIPSIKELKNLKAKGRIYNDGIERVSMYSVRGMKFLPDLANQVKLVATGVEEAPSNTHLEKPVGLYAVEDIYRIQKIIKDVFKQGKK